MRTNRKLTDVTRRFWPVGHQRFEEMCTLAVTAQLGGAQMCELNEHVATCESCRKFLETLAQVSVQAMPLLAEKRTPSTSAVPPANMRERFLARLASEEFAEASGVGQHGAGTPFMNPFPLSRNGRTVIEAREEKRPEPVSKLLFFTRWRILATVGASLLIAIAAFYAGEWKSAKTRQQVAEFHTPTAPIPANLPVADSNRLVELEQQKSELESKLVRLRQELSAAENQRESLSKELMAAREKLATLTAQGRNDSQPSPLASAQTSDQISTLQAEVGRLSQRLADSEIKLAVQKQTSDELAEKLEYTESNLQKERDLKSAKSEIGGLVAARNLHIVDVYDADPNGRRQRSFGRVFYIEGKSLVFYAYDLDDPGRFKANVVFHVWGGKAGVKEVTYSLGILHKDDAGQSRWAMTFDDPKVLGQINAVFVTAESANKHYDEPHGRKVLYAYFGSPVNHP